MHSKKDVSAACFLVLVILLLSAPGQVLSSTLFRDNFRDMNNWRFYQFPDKGAATQFTVESEAGGQASFRRSAKRPQACSFHGSNLM